MRSGMNRNPVMTLVLTLVTCGFYYWYWMWVTCQDINAGLGREEFNPAVEILLGIVTCGLWVLVWDWRAGEAIYELEQTWGVEPEMEPALLFLTNFFGLGPLFYQRSMNNAWLNGAPPEERAGRIEHQQQVRYDDPEPDYQHEPPAGHDGSVDGGSNREGW